MTVASFETPTEFVATIVKAVGAIYSVGVPEIIHPMGFTLRVAGKLPALGEPGLIAQATTAEPFAFNVVGATLML